MTVVKNIYLNDLSNNTSYSVWKVNNVINLEEYTKRIANTSYILGADLILSERESARDIMGSLFDISEFHDVILEPGVRALHQVRADIRAWVQLASAGAKKIGHIK